MDRTSFVDVDWIANVQLDVALAAWVKGVEPVYDLDAKRAVTGPLHEWLDRFIVTVSFDYPDTFVQALRDRRQALAPQVSDVFEGYRRNGTRDFCFWRRFEQRGASTSILVAEKRYLERMLELAQSGDADPSKLYSSRGVDQWLHIRSTIERTGLTAEGEIRAKIVEFICSEAFLNTPYNQISILLWAGIAMLAVNGKKTPPRPSIMTDIDNIAAFMPYCDAMFLDRECAGLLRNIPQAHALPFTTRIFSRANEDEFFQYLADLEAHADPQIKTMGREVYGDRWPSAYVDMYTVEDIPPQQ